MSEQQNNEDLPGDGHDEHREGLGHDLPGLLARGSGRVMARRGLFAAFGALGAAGVVAACTSDDGLVSVTSDGTTGGGPGASGSSSATVAAGEIPEETAGPYPGDGSNGPDALGQSGVVREDITRSFGTADGVAEGVALTIRLRVLSLEDGESTPLEGAAVYLWHATREGGYSMYTEGVTDENYLRGVQVAGADGWLQFRSIVPGCYDGRWPHVHFEVYPSLSDATSAAGRLRTSQLALPQEVCETVYATAGYEASVANLARVSLDSDMVFSDGHSLQLAKVTGSVDEGYTATLAVPV
ncbi:3,4-dioxygenase subunit beta [Nocardioides sp.]|uniref:dioxygenase family protein n=1 Tax=Nocardioides sp. TaxID=35761 RepID=UPI002B626FB9|nr:3,4-dioxygenase subunit beta [Nocardioides sp.]HSX67438.1 3,4-dioxygenase subunit beta [Nocardioides sp.]